MTTPITTYGVTNTIQPGTEKYEFFEDSRGKYFYQYDYRHTDGRLFSCVKSTLEECRQKRDEWFSKNERNEIIAQNGKVILYSPTYCTLGVIFRNLTGENFTSPQDYQDYVQYTAIPGGFDYGEIELWKNAERVRTGTIRREL